MVRCIFLLPLLLVVGCGRGNEGEDGATPTDGVSADSSTDGNTDSVSADGVSADGATADGTPKIVTPTVDDSQERAQVREMDMGKLMESLSDATLSDAASDELASRGADAVKPLIDALDSADAFTQQRAIFTLGQLGPTAKDAVPKLKELAADSNSEVVQDSAKFAIDAIEGN